MTQKNITVNFEPSVSTGYDIRIERGILDKAGENIKNIFQGKRVYVVTDSNVEPLYADRVTYSLRSAGYDVFLYVIKAGEESKTLYELEGILKFLVENGASRKDLLAALGGGVIGDMTGFAAAAYMRGMSYVQIPTTLIAQIDSSIGGKTGVNLEEGKNLVGAFHQPRIVLIDPDCLNTLPQRVLSDGAAEVLKNGYIRDRRIYDIFQKLNCPEDIYKYIDELIYLSCHIKRVVVENDEKEAGERMILNFGHTVGHAYESYYNYKKYTHGEAVALGMAAICGVSERMGFAPKGVTDDLKNMLKNLNLPYEDKQADKREIVRNIFKDKKSNSEYTSLVLLKDIGQVFIKKVPANGLEDFFREGGFFD